MLRQVAEVMRCYDSAGSGTQKTLIRSSTFAFFNEAAGMTAVTKSTSPQRRECSSKENQFQRLIGKWTLVPSLLFQPIIIKKAYPALTRGELDTAVFRAFKAVEVRVRELSGLPSELVGIALMRRAFDPDSGPLTDKSAPKAEREARSHLFTGAIGCLQEPAQSSRRRARIQ